MLDGCVYAVGGWEGSYRLDSVERYDPSTNTWSLIEPMKMAVTSPAVIAHEGMLYVTGESLFSRHSFIWLYNNWYALLTRISRVTCDHLSYSLLNKMQVMYIRRD